MRLKLNRSIFKDEYSCFKHAECSHPIFARELEIFESLGDDGQGFARYLKFHSFAYPEVHPLPFPLRRAAFVAAATASPG